jgi:hypothetical protein
VSNDLVKRYLPTDRERTVAAIAHASVVFSLGLAAPLIWLAFRGNSPFIARHAGRAALTHIIGGAVIFVVSWLTCGLGSVLTIPWVGFSLWEASRAWKGKWDAFERKKLK